MGVIMVAVGTKRVMASGFSTAIEAVFPKTEIQNCIIHQIRNSTKYVSYKDNKRFPLCFQFQFNKKEGWP